MSVYERRWLNKRGQPEVAWYIYVRMQVPGLGSVRIRKASPIATKRGASAYEARVRAALLDGSYWKKEAAPGVVPTLSQFLPRYLTYCENNNKFSTYESKKAVIKNHIEPFFGRMALDAIGPAEIEAFKAAMKRKMSMTHGRRPDASKGAKRKRYGPGQKPISPKTINNVLTVLSKLLNVAEEQGVIRQALRVRRFKTAKPAFDYLSFDEAERLVAAFEPEWRAAVLLALRGGLRLGEIRALKWSDIDFEASFVTVHRNFYKDHLNDSPKGGRGRKVDLPESVIAALKAHRHLKSAWVFSGRDGDPLTQKQLDGPLRRAVRAAGIARDAGRIGWHDLRHTYASHLCMLAVPLRTVSALLGHASIEQTMRYAHLSPETTRDAVRVLDDAALERRKGATVADSDSCGA